MKSHWTTWLVVPALLVTLGGWVPAAEGRRKAKAEERAAEKAEQAAGSHYWIGVMAGQLDPLLKLHLRLEDGVVVQHVVPDSPAAKADIRENDILLKFGDAKAADPVSLSQAVNEAQEHEQTVTLLREGREVKVKVTPRTRPADQELPPMPRAAKEKVAEWLNQLEKGKGEEPFRWFQFGPGLAVPKELRGRLVLPDISIWGKPALKMPKNMSVTITKTDDGPANIVVKQGDQKWEIKEDELDKLPEEVRQVVRSLLGGDPGVAVWEGDGLQLKLGAEAGAATPKAGDDTGVAAQRAKALDALQRKVEEMQRQTQEQQKRLQKELEKLRERLEAKKTES
jgi:membrane-associated protease RseP (regulator of RpoE activity)